MITYLILSVIILMLLSAVSSMTEAALFSLSHSRAEVLAKESNTGKTVLWLKNHSSSVNATIVIINNIVNIAGTFILGLMAAVALKGNTIALNAFPWIFTLAIILFSEIIPKNIGDKHAESVVAFFSRPLRLTTWLFTPIVYGINFLLEKVIGPPRTLQTNEQEVRLLVKRGPFEQDEKEMIGGVFRLNDKTAYDIMTPRTSISFVRGHKTVAECKQEISKSQHSRLLVVGDTIDDVKGVVLKSQILTEIVDNNEQILIQDIADPVVRIEEEDRADNLLQYFQDHCQHLGVVVDEFGGVAGVVTLEDVVEVITGEIVDETDLTKDLAQEARENKINCNYLELKVQPNGM